MEKQRLVQDLRRVFGEVSGNELSQAPDHANFVEIGFDSLMLTQVAQQVKRSFGVPVSFAQLMNGLSTFDALADHLGASIAPEAADARPVAPHEPQGRSQAPPPIAAAAPARVSAGSAGAPGLQSIVQQQLDLMARQIALLGGQAAPRPGDQPREPASASPAATPTSPSPTPPTTTEEEGARARYDVKRSFGAIARIHTSGDQLSDDQREGLASFMGRYVEKTAGSKAYTRTHRPHTADPRVVSGFRPMTKEITYQIVVQRSKGSRLWDIDGNEYVDVLNGFGMNLFGWRPDFLNEALHAQLDAGYEIGPQHVLTGEVSQLLCELTGCDRAALCNTGSEAVMAAIRIARTATGRDTIALFSGSYHGTFDEVLVRAGRDHRGVPAAPGIMPGMFGDVRVLEYGAPESLDYIRTHADELAAVLVEPVQSRRPDLQPREFLTELRALTAQTGICLVFDEVITGFRAHLGGVQALFDIRADLATYGKVIGGGMPIGAVAGRREMMDVLDGGAWDYGDESFPAVGVTYFAGTFVRHPLALAAARAALLRLKSAGPGLQEELNGRAAAMVDEMNAHCRLVGAPLEVRSFSSLFRLAWLEEHPLQDLLFPMMRYRGIHMLDHFPCFLTAAHDEGDVRQVVSAFKESVDELQGSGFLPPARAPVVHYEAERPPVPNARLGRDERGNPAWFVASTDTPGAYRKVEPA